MLETGIFTVLYHLLHFNTVVFIRFGEQGALSMTTVASRASPDFLIVLVEAALTV